MATPWDLDIKTPGDWEQMMKIIEAWQYASDTEDDRPWTASEVEIYVTGSRGELVHGQDAVIHRAMGSRCWPRLKHDFIDCMWESAPLVEDNWRTPQQVRRGLVQLYAEMHEAAYEMGVRLTTIADSECWGGQTIGWDIEPDSARYRWLVHEALPGVFVAATKVGFQTHLRNCRPFDDTYFHARLGIEQCLPLVLAAAANSYDPVRRVASRRFFSFSSLGSCGLFGWQGRDDFLYTLQSWFEDGRLQGPHDWHPWVKPCRGSTEVRVADSLGSVLDAAAIHAVSHALMAYWFAVVESGERPFFMEGPFKTDRLQHALALAAAHGTSRPDLRIPNPFGKGTQTFEALYLELNDRIGPVMANLGYGWERHHFFEEMVANRNNGAERQRRWWRDSCDPLKVLAGYDTPHLKESLDDATGLIEAGVW